ncbi:uncharacterized protein NPIL_685261 [Nephila pilipes]|uniref:Cilia- and flagella-associated protein 45 n=1 Tax=Nephila pilipes TaxID=299642 RepID=A0A8X6J584_NEPPI|nr:uncharacterized protein NPIL_685261 [Nephila pilipes]
MKQKFKALIELKHQSIINMNKKPFPCSDYRRNSGPKIYKDPTPFMTVVDVAPEDREEIHFMSRDLARKLIVPRTDKRVKGLINQEKFEQLKKAALVSLKKEEEVVKEAKRKNWERLQKEQEARKAEFESWDLVRKKNEQLNELEEEAKQKMEHMRQKADETIKEQNEEIKEINKLILSAKVQAIRDAQVDEKKHIKKEHIEAEKNLDEIMEKERRKGVLKERDMLERRKEACYQAASHLQEQIKENKERKLLEEESKIKEGDLLLKKLKEDQMRDYQEMKIHHAKKKAIFEELTKGNEEILKRKVAARKISEKEDKVIAEYQRLKAAQEEAKEVAEKEAKRQREMELTKLGEMQERASSLYAEQEALRARRAQEEKEREYRKKEKLEALKKKKTIEDLKRSRAQQLEHQENLKRVKAATNIKELEKLLEKLKLETQEEERKKLFKKLANLKHLEELKEQMRKKEIEKITEKKEFYKEGIHLQQEEKRRYEMLDMIKKEKLNELRKHNVPEIYINHIKRKINLQN